MRSIPRYLKQGILDSTSKNFGFWNPDYFAWGSAKWGELRGAKFRAVEWYGGAECEVFLMKPNMVSESNDTIVDSPNPGNCK